MKKLYIYLFIILCALFSSSCLREDLSPCPPLKIELTVKDKNYFNVNDIEIADAVREDLPFREYVSTICWTLREYESGKIVAEERVTDVTENTSDIFVDLGNELPFGKYVFTVWGNLSDHEPLGEDPSSIDFHPENTEGGDIYMTTDILDYTEENSDFLVELERTKGKLLIEKVNVPASFTYSDKRIDGLYGRMDTSFNYEGETFIKVRTFLPGDNKIITGTILSPSVEGKGATVSLNFSTEDPSGENGGKVLQPRDNLGRAIPANVNPEDVNIEVKRNTLTVLRYEWDDEEQGFRIFVLIDAGWEEFYKLEL